MNFQEFLKNEHACEEATYWIADKTAEQAWEQCARADWMFWLISRIVHGQELTHKIVRAAADIARTVLAHTTDRRAHDCLAAVERWLAGEQVDLRAAEDTAWAAAWAARAAEAAAARAAEAAAARAAEAAAYAAYAAGATAEAAAGAAEAAAYAAGAAEAAAYAAGAAATRAAGAAEAAAYAAGAAQAQHADIVRKHLPWTLIQPLLERALQDAP